MIKNPKLVGVSYVKKNRDVGDNCSAFTAPSVMGFSLYDQCENYIYQNKEYERKQQHAVLFSPGFTSVFV